MSRYLYHPYGDNALNANPYTRSGHGCGKLDMNGNHTPFYAMCNGQIVSVGTYSDGNFYCTQLCEDNALGMPFYIRYLHGDYVVNSGDYVTAGTLLGYTTTNNGKYNDHLHIDFIWGAGGWDSANDKGQSGPVAGTFNSDKTIYTVSGKQLKIKPNIINWNQLENWKNTDGSSNYGYCWVVFAQTPRQMKAYQSSGNSDKLKVTIDDYIAKVFVGLVGLENSWNNAAVAQGTLTVCRNWIYADCYNKLGKTNLSFTYEDVQQRNGLADHFARFINGTNWQNYNDWINLSSTYVNKKVPGTNLTALEFVKQFLSSGEHWPYIDQAIDNGRATLYSGRSKIDTEDLMGFPSSGYESQRVVLIPNFSDWLLGWGYGEDTQGLDKPSALLLNSGNNTNIVQVGKEVIDVHYNNYLNVGSPYYSNFNYLNTTVNNRAISSRRDCSGFINGIWQALGDLSSSTNSLTTYTYKSQHPLNWELISLNGFSNSDLKPGDVIFREGATHGHSDGRTELIVSVNGNSVQTYALGSDSAMIASSTSTNYLANNITHYDYILRRK